MRRILWPLVLMVLLSLPACSDNDNVAQELDLDRDGFTAYFDLTPGVNAIPFPNNLLYSGSQDGTLNIPPTDPDNPTDSSDPKVAMAALETFGGTLPVGGPTNGIVGELTFGVDFMASLSSVDLSGSTLVILPLKPLNPSSHYLVALTDDIKSVTGSTAQTSAHYLIAKSGNPLIDEAGASQHPAMDNATAATFESVRQLVNAQEAVLGLAGVDTSRVILSWTFSTQSAGDVLGTVNAIVKSTPAPASFLVDSGADSPFGAADIYAGTLDVPYYLTAAADTHDPAPLSTWWQAQFPAFDGDTEKNLTFLNPLPAATDIQTIPLLATVPKGVKPATGWPVVIFQHGITQNRTNLLAIADSLSSAGFAAVAIDMPLHGLTGAQDEVESGTVAFRAPGLERTFDLDLVNNETGATGPDGVIDDSGTHFINLASLLTTRDNGRQAIADLFALTKSLETMDADGGGADFDTDQIYFVGHSLGGILGSVFLALEPTVSDAVLGMAGGGIGKMFDGSAVFGPRLESGLAAKGVLKGSADYESFIGAFQTVVDTADPINYAAYTTVGRDVLLFEVLDDQAVPNNVMADAPAGTVPSPLAGTDPLAFFMGLEVVDTTTTGSEFKAQLCFISGDHSSLLDPTSDPLVTSVMQGAMATFLATDGGMIVVADDTVLE